MEWFFQLLLFLLFQIRCGLKFIEVSIVVIMVRLKQIIFGSGFIWFSMLKCISVVSSVIMNMLSIDQQLMNFISWQSFVCCCCVQLLLWCVLISSMFSIKNFSMGIMIFVVKMMMARLGEFFIYSFIILLRMVLLFMLFRFIVCMIGSRLVGRQKMKVVISSVQVWLMLVDLCWCSCVLQCG